MSLKPVKIAVFVGSARISRMGIRVAKWVQTALKDDGYEVDFFDPADIKFPVIEQPIHLYADKTQVPDWLKKLDTRVRQADAYVVVSGEYNNSIPPALTNMMNHFPPDSYAFKPSAIVTYSINKTGGVLATAQLRTFLSILGSPSIPFALSIPEVDKVINETGRPMVADLDRRMKKVVEQLDWLTLALKE